MKLRQSNRSAEEKALQSLTDNLEVLDSNIEKADALAENIRLRIMNCDDDSIKVTRAMENAKAQGAYSDAAILAGKCSQLAEQKAALEQDYDRVYAHGLELKKTHDELTDKIRRIRQGAVEIEETLEEAQASQMANEAYASMRAAEAAQQEKMQEARRAKDQADAMRSLDSERVLEGLESKYTN